MKASHVYLLVSFLSLLIAIGMVPKITLTLMSQPSTFREVAGSIVFLVAQNSHPGLHGPQPISPSRGSDRDRSLRTWRTDSRVPRLICRKIFCRGIREPVLTMGIKRQ